MEDEEKLEIIQQELLGQRTPEKPMDEAYHPADIAAAIQSLEDKSKVLKAFQSVGVDLGSEVLPLLEDPAREHILSNTPPETLAEIIVEMDSDDAADILGEMDSGDAEEVLDAAPVEVDEEVSRLMLFGPETAGGLMQTELFSVDQSSTLDETLALFRSLPEINREVYNMFVIDKDGKLKGVLPIIELLLNPGDRNIAGMIDESHPPIYVFADEDQEHVAQVFKKYDLISVAVVDRDMVLLGRVLIDDIVDVIEEEADEDIMRLAGAEEEILSRAISPVEMARYRLPWLATSLGGGFATGALIWLFRGTLEGLIALATFIPMVMGISGNVGIQSSTLVIRGLATGRLAEGSLVSFLFKELRVGLILGVVCGLLSGVVAGLWQASPELGVIVGISILLAIFLAAFLGAVVPLFFQWMEVDPAIAGGPIVLALNDITAIFIYLSVATLLIHFLL